MYHIDLSQSLLFLTRSASRNSYNVYESVWSAFWFWFSNNSPLHKPDKCKKVSRGEDNHSIEYCVNQLESYSSDSQTEISSSCSAIIFRRSSSGSSAM